MNYHINDSTPNVLQNPAIKGLTMVMDKGLACARLEDFIEMGGAYTDLIKLGWATSFCYAKPGCQAKAVYRCRLAGLFWRHSVRGDDRIAGSLMIIAAYWINTNGILRGI
jgi:hypothetical protein